MENEEAKEKASSKKGSKLKIVKIIWNIIVKIIAVIIVLISIIIVVQKVTNNKEAFLGYRIFRVQTGSMIPKYLIGDVILVKQKDVDQIKVGDDVVYLGQKGDFNGKIVTHRVIEIKETNGKRQFITKGIANDLEDPVIDSSQVYGKVLFKSKVLSFLSKLINNLYGFYFIVFVPFVIMLFIEIIDIVNEKEELKKVKVKNKANLKK